MCFVGGLSKQIISSCVTGYVTWKPSCIMAFLIWQIILWFQA